MESSYEDHDSRQNRITSLFNKLVDYVELDDETLSYAARELCDIYLDEGFRHSYSEISLVLGEYMSDQRDALCEHMKLIQDKAHTTFQIERALSESAKKTIERKCKKDH